MEACDGPSDVFDGIDCSEARAVLPRRASCVYIHDYHCAWPDVPEVCTMIPRNRPPTAPGVVLREEFLLPLGMTQAELARRMGVPLQRINLLVNGKRALTADTAVRLAAVFQTTPELWMNLQVARDLWFARRAFKGLGTPGRTRS